MSDNPALECLKLSATLVSPSVQDREKEVEIISEKLYVHYRKLMDMGFDPHPISAIPDKPRRGSPPKP